MELKQLTAATIEDLQRLKKTSDMTPVDAHAIDLRLEALGARPERSRNLTTSICQEIVSLQVEGKKGDFSVDKSSEINAAMRRLARLGDDGFRGLHRNWGYFGSTAQNIALELPEFASHEHFATLAYEVLFRGGAGLSKTLGILAANPFILATCDEHLATDIISRLELRVKHRELHNVNCALACRALSESDDGRVPRLVLELAVQGGLWFDKNYAVVRDSLLKHKEAALEEISSQTQFKGEYGLARLFSERFLSPPTRSTLDRVHLTRGLYNQLKHDLS